MRSQRALSVALLLTFLASAAHAKTDPVVACAALKLRTTGALTNALLVCNAKAAHDGVDVEQECLDVAQAKLAARFAKAEAVARKAGKPCKVENNAADIQIQIGTSVAGMVTTLHPLPGLSKCAAKKLSAVGKHVVQILGAHARNLIKPAPDALGSAKEKAGENLKAGFAKAEKKGNDCQTVGDEATAAGMVAILVGGEVCNDRNQCTIDTLTGLQTCLHTPVVCGAYEVCDFRTGSCEASNCCLMSFGVTSCVVPIPIDKIPTSQAFCANVDAEKPALTLINVGPSCIGWRAAGADDCP